MATNFNDNSSESYEQKSKAFGQILENIDDIIWKLDLKSQKFTYISPSVEKVRGITAEQAMASSLKESLPQDEYEKIQSKIEELRELAKSGQEFSRDFKFETKHFKNQTDVIWLDVKATLLLDENGEPSEVIGVSRDITHQKNQRIELEKSLEREKFFADIIRNSSQAIGIGYEDGSGLFINDAGFDLIGYTQDELQKMNWIYDLTPPKWLTKEMQILKECIKSKKPVTYQKEYIHKNGRIIPVELMVHPKFDENEKLVHFIAFVKDISEIEATKKELQFTNERLEFALKGANDGIWDWDLKTNYLYMSPRYLEMLGYSDSEVEYHIDFFNRLLPNDEIEDFKQYTKQYITNTQLRSESTFNLKHKNGHIIPVLSRAYKIVDENGQVNRIVGTHTDLTDFNTLKNTLEENEQKYKYLFDHSNIGIGISTMDGELIEANQFLLNLFQISKNDIAKIKLRNHYKNKEVRDQFIELINKKGEVKNFCFEMITQNKQSAWVSLSTKKIIHKGKTRLINAITNIDQQIKSEQKLKESEERFKQLSKLTTEGILIHQNGIVLDINDSLLKMLGYKREDILNQSFISFCQHKKET